MSKPQVPIGVSITHSWQIRRPWVFRYMPRKYVDDFFADGSLRLSSFAAFSKHADEQRRDSSEGLGVVINTSTEGQGQTVSATLGMGRESYVMCGSLLKTAELGAAFGSDSGFRINDTTAFAVEIANCLAGFRGGREGACIYVPTRTLARSAPPIDLEGMTADGASGAIDMSKMLGAITDYAGDDLYFLKPSTYQHQVEYRLLWSVSSPADYIDIKCPLARQFCTRFEDC